MVSKLCLVCYGCVGVRYGNYEVILMMPCICFGCRVVISVDFYIEV